MTRRRWRAAAAAPILRTIGIGRGGSRRLLLLRRSLVLDATVDAKIAIPAIHVESLIVVLIAGVEKRSKRWIFLRD